MKRSLIAVGMAAVLFAIAAPRAEAVPFVVAGTTTAGFNGGASADIATLGPLTFDGNDTGFTIPTTFDPFLGQQGATSDLGTFTLNPGAFPFTGKTFQLQLHFTSPPGANPNPSTNTALLLGNIAPNNAGGVTIFFSSPAFVTFDTGSFTFFANTVSLKVGQTVEQSGFLFGDAQAAAVPEPGSMLLFGSGLFGLAGIARKRFGRPAVA